MVKQDINISTKNDSSYRYLIKMLKTGVDESANMSSQFVFIRKYTVTNNVVFDTDIYLIERSLLKETPENIIWPMTTSRLVGFSANPGDYFEILDGVDFTENDDDVNEIYEFVDGEPVIASIPCDILQLYHPHNKVDIDAILYLSAQVQNITVHVFCNLVNDLPSRSGAEFEEEHILYCEYKEALVPCIEKLMSGKYFYKETLTNIDLEETDDVTSDQYIVLDDDLYASMKLYSFPYIMSSRTNPETGEEENTKKYMPRLQETVRQNYIAYPEQVIMFPYSTVDVNSSIYIEDENLFTGSDMIYQESFVTLNTKLGFDDHSVISCICTFQFPSTEKFGSFREAYEYFYGVDLTEYEGIVEYNPDDPDEEEVEQKQCGFEMMFYSDYDQSHHMFDKYFEIGNPAEELDNFAFQLTEMFTRWEELPDILMIQCRFIDKYLGNIIYSNPVYVSKEYYKYLINDIVNNNIDTTKTRINVTGNQNNINTLSDMNLEQINFIDKVNCNIIRKEPVEEQSILGTNRQNARVVFKPIFYRVQDLQSISIRNGLKQKIGVALGDYMTKVETFKMYINGNIINEFGRNDIYVIFEIDATLMDEKTGSYHICDQDGDYISTGEYNVIS